MPSVLNRINSTRSTISSKEHKCIVQLLDDSQTITVDFKKDDTGQIILDYVCEMLNLAEKDYFGLRYVDANRHRYWLDASKPILRQVKKTSPIVFTFRVKYYPVDPTILQEQLTRYLLTLQLKRDLLHGRLYCPQNDAAVLGSYIVQAELGDYDPAEHKGNYVSQFKMFLNQTPRVEEKVALEHQLLKGKGITPTDADFEFLKKASNLETYGYYPFTVKDIKGGQLYVGGTPGGLLIYQAHKKLHHLRWNDIKGFDYSGKEFHIFVSEEYSNDHEIGEEGEYSVSEQEEKRDSSSKDPSAMQTDQNAKNPKKKPRLRVICPSATFCKHLWKYMLGQQAFFTKKKSDEVHPVVIRRGPLLKRATFRYSGRVLQEIKDSSSPKRAEPAFERIHIQRQLPRDERNTLWANKFHTLPRTMKAVQEEQPDLLNTSLPVGASSTVESYTLNATSTPIISPVKDQSPSTDNGPFNVDKRSSTEVKTQFVEQSITTTTTDTNGCSYQSEVITVCLKRVEEAPVNEVKKQNMDRISSSREAEPSEEANKASNEFRTIPSPAHPVTMEQSSNTYRSFLTGLIFLLLFTVTIVLVMEIQDDEFRRHIRQITGNDTFRHNVYNPIRRRVVDMYGRVFQ